MNAKFVKASSLEEIAAAATKEINEGESRYSYLLAYELNAKDLIDNELKDQTDSAKRWSSEERPPELHFSHGEYRKGGLEYIKKELKNKPSSNRALYSLINQKDISDSGDKPIPSFMVFQTILEGDVLYCSVYFRALEISNFLRVNLEEIRLNIKEIKNSSLNFSIVRLSIFSARAYNTKDFKSLNKPKLDTLGVIDIVEFLLDETKRSELSALIKEKAEPSSVVEFDSLQLILDYIEKWPDQFQNHQQLTNHLITSISISKDLANKRKNHSHNPDIKELSKKLSKSLDELSKAFSP